MLYPITSLILELSRAGWRTLVTSWEDGTNSNVRISFGSASELQAFLDVVAPLDRDEDSVTKRARANWGGSERGSDRRDKSSSAHLDGQWRFHVGRSEPRNSAHDVGVIFPRADLEAVLDRVREMTASPTTAER